MQYNRVQSEQPCRENTGSLSSFVVPGGGGSGGAGSGVLFATSAVTRTSLQPSLSIFVNPCPTTSPGPEDFMVGITVPGVSTDYGPGLIITQKELLYVFPFITGGIAKNITSLGTVKDPTGGGAPGALCRVGLYDNSGGFTNPYPNNKLAEVELDISALGQAIVTSSFAAVNLTINSIYWTAIVMNNTANSQLRGSQFRIAYLGNIISSGVKGALGYYVTFPYATLPSTFPTPPTAIITTSDTARMPITLAQLNF